MNALSLGLIWEKSILPPFWKLEQHRILTILSEGTVFPSKHTFLWVKCVMANIKEMALTFRGISFWGDLKITEGSRGIRHLLHLSLSQTLERESHFSILCVCINHILITQYVINTYFTCVYALICDIDRYQYIDMNNLHINLSEPGNSL